VDRIWTLSCYRIGNSRGLELAARLLVLNWNSEGLPPPFSLTPAQGTLKSRNMNRVLILLLAIVFTSAVAAQLREAQPLRAAGPALPAWACATTLLAVWQFAAWPRKDITTACAGKPAYISCI